MNRLDNQVRQNGAGCADVRASLSEYTDNLLSAHSAWSVEKHLAGCTACAAEAREMQATVALLRSVPRLDTSDDFMALLHAKLDTMDPETTSEQSPWTRMRAWLLASNSRPFANRVPAMSLGLAVVAVTLFVAANRPGNPGITAATMAPGFESVHVSIALSANSPFSDPAADNLEFRSSSLRTGAPAPF